MTAEWIISHTVRIPVGTKAHILGWLSHFPAVWLGQVSQPLWDSVNRDSKICPTQICMKTKQDNIYASIWQIAKCSLVVQQAPF